MPTMEKNISADASRVKRSVRPAAAKSRGLTDDGPTSWLFAVPGLIILVTFCLYPFVNTVRLSFTNARMLTAGHFVGLDNYIKLFSDARFHTAFLNSTLYVVCVVPFMVILPLILASLVTGNSRIIGFFRTTYYFPVVLSAVVVGLIWTNILDTKGLVNSMLQALHIITEPIPFLTDRWLTLFSAMFVTIWLGLGYYMIIYISALANIDRSLYEAAQLDGAGPIRQFLHITIPGCKSTMFLILLLSSVSAFRVFNEVYVITRGTAGIGGEDITMTYLIQQEGTGLNARTGYASAISVVLLVIVGIITVIQLVAERKGGDND